MCVSYYSFLRGLCGSVRGLAVALPISDWSDKGASSLEWPLGVRSSQDILRTHKGRLASRHNFPLFVL